MVKMRVSPLAYRVWHTLRRDCGIRPGARLVVGVSGGPDSVALLALLAELRPLIPLTLWGLYINHGWRPAAARREAAFVRRLGRRLGVPIRIVEISARKRPRHSWEGTARADRYTVLTRMARRLRAVAVAVGHTLEDQAETVLLALARGSGLLGVAGMPAARPLDGTSVALVRPLLRVRHADLMAYLRRRRLSWMVDATNRQRRFRRNALRQRLLPSLVRQFGPQVVERLATCAELAQADEAWLQGQVARWCRRQGRRRARGVTLPVAALRRQPVALQRRALRWAVQQATGSLTGLTFRHVAAMGALVRRGAGQTHLPRGLTATVADGALIVHRR